LLALCEFLLVCANFCTNFYAIFIKFADFEAKICEFNAPSGFHEFCGFFEITAKICAIFIKFVDFEAKNLRIS
jgi:hypothetical protein